MVVKQLKAGFDNFSYVIYCSNKKECAIVDPSFDTENAINFLSEKNLNLKYIILTHYHSDHTNDTEKIKKLFPSSETVASKSDGEKMGFSIDIYVSDGDRIKVGDVTLNFILTPGHTQGGIHSGHR